MRKSQCDCGRSQEAARGNWLQAGLYVQGQIASSERRGVAFKWDCERHGSWRLGRESSTPGGPRLGVDHRGGGDKVRMPVVFLLRRFCVEK